MSVRSKFSRRRVAFWCGLGLFCLSRRTGVQAFDELAANLMPQTTTGDSQTQSVPAKRTSKEVHWHLASNRTWRWYEREERIDGHWVVTGITTPIKIATGESLQGVEGYLDEAMIPDYVLNGDDQRRLGRGIVVAGGVESGPGTVIQQASGEQTDLDPASLGDASQGDAGRPSATRRSRHGRPPSRWLRSLNADELRLWLGRVDIQVAYVDGMTYWTHLTRDHSFDPEKIRGLNEAELAELHGAAHEGY